MHTNQIHFIFLHTQEMLQKKKKKRVQELDIPLKI